MPDNFFDVEEASFETQYHWNAVSTEPIPVLRGQTSCSLLFYGEAPEVNSPFIRLSLPNHTAYALRYAYEEIPRTEMHSVPIRRLSAHIVHLPSEEVIGYLRAYQVGAEPHELKLENLAACGERISLDFGGALSSVISRHLMPSELLNQGLRTHALVHIDLLEVAVRHQGQGVGVEAVRILMGHLSKVSSVGVFTYRPFPCQYAETEVLSCVFSNAPIAVELYKAFLTDTASLSRYYAQKWNAHRLPGTEYFIAVVGDAFTLAFNSATNQWALLPGP